MGILVHELSILYRTHCNCELPTANRQPLPPLPIQYSDFARWQRSWLRGEVLEEQLGYWRRQLAGVPRLELPTDRPYPPVQTFRGASWHFDVPQELAHCLRSLGRDLDATLFVTLMAAFGALLSRYSGQTAFAVGSPIANRNRQEIEPLIGFFVNTLAMRLDLSGDPDFVEVVRRVRRTALDAYAHQDLPFEQLVEELHPERSLSRPPLVQVVLALQNAPKPPLELPGLKLSQLAFDHPAVRFDLELHLWELEVGIEASLTYNTDLFDASTMRRLARHFEIVLRRAVQDPRQKVLQLPLLTDSERHQALLAFNDTSAPPSRRCIHNQVESQATQRPDAIALEAAVSGQSGAGSSSQLAVGSSQSGARNPEPGTSAETASFLTYRRLDQGANRIAHWLRSQGVGRETPVAVLAERTPRTVAALLGILKAGAAYLPLDPALPPERLAVMLEEARTPLAIGRQALLEALPPGGLPTLCPSESQEQLQQPESPPEVETAPANLAYVIFTSGSTGRPKGVMVPHQGLSNLVSWHHEAFALTASDRTSHLAGTAFDASVMEIWAALSSGAALALAGWEEASDPSALQDWLQRHRVTLSFAPTPLAELLLQRGWERPSALRALLTGGDRLKRRPGKASPFPLSNIYGPAESSVATTSGWVRPDRPGLAPSIGRPIRNTWIYLLDRRLQPVPLGVPGELCIAGTGLARGYLAHPAWTSEKFLPNPFSRLPGQRLYRSGDLARHRADGRIECLGRIDHQVQLRGFRIELGEVEAALLQHPAVREVVVVERESQLVAYLATESRTAAEGRCDPHWGSRRDWEEEQIAHWKTLYQETYLPPTAGDDPEFHIVGWKSSYNGQPIPAAEMREWVEGTVQRIRSLQAAGSADPALLEIGCGSGLLLSRLAPRCRRYRATDFSPQAVAHIERLKKMRPRLQHVQADCRPADD
ncbi:MAG: amino acid adenylation domain-containing protein, partial [Acidobacteriota bacterium]